MATVSLENGVQVDVDVSDLSEEVINMEPCELLPQRPYTSFEGDLKGYVPESNGRTRLDTPLGTRVYFQKRFSQFVN